jgi:hypothetical protein
MKIQHITLNEILDSRLVADTRKRDFQRYKQTMDQAGQKLDKETFKQAMNKIFAAKGQEFNLPMPTNFANDTESLDWINKASALYVQDQLFKSEAPTQDTKQNTSAEPDKTAQSSTQQANPVPTTMDVATWINFFKKLKPADKKSLRKALGI